MISAVIPFFNEEKSLPILYEELIRNLGQIDKDYEIIFIDDGSKDRSLEVVKSFIKKDTRLRIFSFRRNFGKAEALTLGFAKAKGDFIVTLDADLQDMPSEIKILINKAKKGFDLVCGWRKDRKDSLIKVVFSKIFNALSGSLWGLKIHDYNCGLKVFSKEAAKSLRLYGGLHRFIPVLLHAQGFSVSEETVDHDPRKFGRSKYGFSKLWKDLPDIFTMLFLTHYGKRPLHFFSMVGIVLFLLGMFMLGYLSIIHFQGIAIGHRPLLFLGIMLVLSGFQVLFTGFLADLIISTSYHTKGEDAEQEKFLLKYTSD